MEQRHYILATAGHIDHGKSALVEALTGARTMRLPEEQARGITIDLGFAHLELPPFNVGVIDVPGHEDFVKNMVAGIGSIDVALIVVAADDGWMPQTEEHLQILSYLGVTRGAVALTKIDLAQDEQQMAALVRQRLAGSAFGSAPIVPTSIITGRGIDQLRRVLHATLEKTPPPSNIHKPRLPIDRAFRMKGVGTVVTGTLSGGELQVGQEVLIQPHACRTRVRSIQSHNRDADVAAPGQRVALNLPDVRPRAAGESGTHLVQRGQVIALPDCGSASTRWDVWVERMDRPVHHHAAAPPLKSGARVHLHHGSADHAARISLIGARDLQPGQQCLAQLRFDEPVFAFAGDRFVIRDWSARHTLAGGLVLDEHGARPGDASSASRIALLRQRAATPDDVSVWIETELAWRRVVPRAALLQQSRFARRQIEETLQRFVAERRAVVQGEYAVEPQTWKMLNQRAVQWIDAAHRAHPDQPGATLLDLRKAVVDRVTRPLFEPLVSALCADGFVRRGNCVGRATHQPQLPPHLMASAQRILAALHSGALEPPSRKELVPDPQAHQAMKFLIHSGEIVLVGPELLLLREQLEQATRKVVEHLTQHGSATAGELRQVLGTTRRIIVPLLEYLDNHGITRREADLRRLRGRSHSQR